MIDRRNPDYTNTPVSPSRPLFHHAPVDVQGCPIVTIVTPFYNTGTIFHDTALSVFRQSCQQWEWLIVNDGSKDEESLAILETYRSADPRIQIIDLGTNKGPSMARNKGFSAARAEFVVQLDSDDLLEPTAIEKWAWFLISYPEQAFVYGYEIGFEAEQYMWELGFRDGREFLKRNLLGARGMIRRSVHEAVGGYDENLRTGFEDWDFWLKCANAGYWGGTVEEYLGWYRRRPTHSDKWKDFGTVDQQRSFGSLFRDRYPELWNGGFPQIQHYDSMPNETVPDELPFVNRLQKVKPRLLMILPWLSMGGSDKFNLDLLEQLNRRGWEVSIATTLNGDQSWASSFARYTPDIFILHRFLRVADYPRFLRYLIESRQVDVVLISHSELGYALLPYLRAHCPRTAFMDYCHIEEAYWKNGGYPRMAVEHQELLDLNVVSSQHLKEWMANQGGDPRRIKVSYTNIDPERWRPDADRRAHIRQELGVATDLPVLLYAGRVCDQKQPRVFAHTMLQLSRREFSFAALVAGDGPDLNWLRTFVKQHRLDNRVRLLGAVSNERIRDLMVASDLFFLPSLWEGIALSFYEAMASSLAVVGADVGGQRELATPECGVLISRSNEGGETERYVQVLAELLGEPRRIQTMGRAGRKRVEGLFRLEQMAERMTGLLREAIRLHVEQPRPQVSVGLGRMCAWRMVEQVRIEEVANRLWWEREQGKTSHVSWRASLFFALRRLLLPYFRMAVSREATWLIPLKNKLKVKLLR